MEASIIRDLQESYESIYYYDETSLFGDIVNFCIESGVFDNYDEAGYFAEEVIAGDLVSVFFEDIQQFYYDAENEYLTEEYALDEGKVDLVLRTLNAVGGLLKKAPAAAKGMSSKTLLKKGFRPTDVTSKGQLMTGPGGAPVPRLQNALQTSTREVRAARDARRAANPPSSELPGTRLRDLQVQRANRAANAYPASTRARMGAPAVGPGKMRANGVTIDTAPTAGAFPVRAGAAAPRGAAISSTIRSSRAAARTGPNETAGRYLDMLNAKRAASGLDPLADTSGRLTGPLASPAGPLATVPKPPSTTSITRSPGRPPAGGGSGPGRPRGPVGPSSLGPARAPGRPPDVGNFPADNRFGSAWPPRSASPLPPSGRGGRPGQTPPPPSKPPSSGGSGSSGGRPPSPLPPSGPSVRPGQVSSPLNREQPPISRSSSGGGKSSNNNALAALAGMVGLGALGVGLATRKKEQKYDVYNTKDPNGRIRSRLRVGPKIVGPKIVGPRIVGDTFNDAFREARRKGLKTFRYGSGDYNTELATEDVYYTVINYLIDEGFATDESSAHIILESMSEEWFDQVITEAFD